jgi:hypothetical protein
MVEVKLNSAVVQYPGCVLENQQIRTLGRQQQWSHTSLLGAGVFLEEEERQRYGFLLMTYNNQLKMSKKLLSLLNQWL